MSILGYSSSYFLPEYWANTPLYGEKIIPLLDYLLSSEYEESEKLAKAFYNIENKYKNISNLPINKIEEIIDESGYSYVKDLLGGNETSLRLLITLMVLIHQLKGTKLGIQVVLNLLRRDNSIITMQTMGNPVIDDYKNVSNFTTKNYIIFNDFSAEGNSIEIDLKIGGFNFNSIQCIASVADRGLYLGLNTQGQLVLSLGSNRTSWNILNNIASTKSLVLGSEYYIKLQFDGYEYSLKVSQDGKDYETWILEESTESLNIHRGTLYLGVDNSVGTIRRPFTGYINFSEFSVGAENIEITQWFEQTPVGAENTFLIKTDLEVDLVSTAFFNNFSKFIKHYVYPTLQAFTAGLNFNGAITFLPYARTHLKYIAYGDVSERGNFLVKTDTSSVEATDKFIVVDGESGEADFDVVLTGVIEPD